MNAMTIPQLNLFNRRSSPIKKDSYATKRDFYSTRGDVLDSNNYNYLTGHLYSLAAEQKYPIGTLSRGLSSQSRYKQIAEDYLQKKVKVPSYYLQPTPYVYNVPSYIYPPSPQRSKKNPCQCEILIPHKDNFQQKIHRNPYIGLKQDLLRQKQPRILKQPYLQPTFREGKRFLNLQQPIKRQNSLMGLQQAIKQNLYSYQNQVKKQYIAQNLMQNLFTLLSNVQNSNHNQLKKKQMAQNLIQRLITHQSDRQQQILKLGYNNNLVTQKYEASIQTQKNQLNQSTQTNKQTRRQQKDQSAKVQKILQEQKVLIESLKFEFQKQNQFKFDVEDLLQTKNDYFDRSRQLLLKLNQLADDKIDFSSFFKGFGDKRKHNVFSSLQI